MWSQSSQHQAQEDRRAGGAEPYSPESSQEQDLRERIHRHRICWHAWPEHRVRGTERQQVGFRLGLLGSHDLAGAPSITSSATFWELYTSLHDLARWILPQEEEGDLEISIFDASLTSRGDRQDVVVTIKITHRQGFEQPVEAGELRCLATMADKLRQLGAPQERWV